MTNEIQNQNEVEETNEEAKEESNEDILDKKIATLNDLTARNEKALQDMKVERAISGSSDAGQEAEKPKEETPEEYAKRVMAGDLN
jgi:hypothetical protein